MQQPQGQNQMQKNSQNAIFAQVNDQISAEEDKGLALPAGYSLNNALKAAWFKLQNTRDKFNQSVLDVCDPNSVGLALMDMAVQGLSPAKNQCYFIVYGNQLQMQRSYFGTITVLKRLERVVDIDAQVVHKGDEFEIGADEIGHTIVKKFVPKFENLDNPLIGAFAFIKLADGRIDYTVMTKKQIDTSWAQSRQHNVQQKFSDEMAKRTVLNRAAKIFINTSDDSDLLTGAINRATEAEYDNDQEQERKEVAPAEKGTPNALLAGFKRKQAQTAKETPKEEPKQEVKEAPKQAEKSSEDIVKQLTEPDDKIPAEDLPFPETPENGSESEAVADGQTDIYDYIDEDKTIKDYGDKVGGVNNAN